MTDTSDLLHAEAVRIGASAATKKALFTQFGAVARDTLGLDGAVVADRLAAREKLGSTGFGNGVAIPHAKLAGLPRVTGMLIRLAQPMEFKAVDDQPVDLAFALLSPADAGADHLKALARVSRRLRDPRLVAKLRGAGSPDALWALWSEEGARDAA